MTLQTMQAMVLDRARTALHAAELPMPEPSPHQLRLRVLACGVCRTDLHIVDGELAQPKLPLVLGHEIVGRIDAMGGEVQGFAAGDRVGVPWLGFTDGTCPYCRNDQENLCDNARFTGCMTCNIWWSAEGKKIRLSEEDLRALHALRRET